jgi:hypothetical protein
MSIHLDPKPPTKGGAGPSLANPGSDASAPVLAPSQDAGGVHTTGTRGANPRTGGASSTQHSHATPSLSMGSTSVPPALQAQVAAMTTQLAQSLLSTSTPSPSASWAASCLHPMIKELLLHSMDVSPAELPLYVHHLLVTLPDLAALAIQDIPDILAGFLPTELRDDSIVKMIVTAWCLGQYLILMVQPTVDTRTWHSWVTMREPPKVLDLLPTLPDEVTTFLNTVNRDKLGRHIRQVKRKFRPTLIQAIQALLAATPPPMAKDLFPAVPSFRGG